MSSALTWLPYEVLIFSSIVVPESQKEDTHFM